ncbi:MAG: hypothetical protein LBI14_03375 [Treponema sp.]|jgi:hypothetical protein|nr:hypothetical protein [Treponema sp.]
MAIKVHGMGAVVKKAILLGVWLLLSASFLYAQVGSSTEIRIVQRLAWRGDQNALRYEVVIEREEDGRFREMLREFTNASYMEVVLSPGRYRYQIIPYDFLNRPAAATDWVNLEIRPAIRPELNDTLLAFFNINERSVYVLEIFGRNIDQGAEIELRRPGSAPIIPYDKDIRADGTRATLYFNNNQLIPGVYEVRVRNPGGFETRGGTITIVLPEQVAQVREGEPAIEIKEPEPIVQDPPTPRVVRTPVKLLQIDNAYFGVAWMPLFPVYGEGDWFYERNNTLTGAVARFGLCSKVNNIYVGMELTGSWYAYKTDFSESLMHFMTIGVNILAQKWFFEERLALVFRAGGGASILLSNKMEDSDSSERKPLYLDLGLSFLWLMNKRLYFEAGVDYYHWFTETPSGSFRPWVGIGLKL